MSKEIIIKVNKYELKNKTNLKQNIRKELIHELMLDNK